MDDSVMVWVFECERIVCARWTFMVHACTTSLQPKTSSNIERFRREKKTEMTDGKQNENQLNIFKSIYWIQKSNKIIFLVVFTALEICCCVGCWLFILVLLLQHIIIYPIIELDWFLSNYVFFIWSSENWFIRLE